MPCISKQYKYFLNHIHLLSRNFTISNLNHLRNDIDTDFWWNACMYSSPLFVSHLIRLEPNIVNCIDSKGNTGLMYAVEYSTQFSLDKMVDILINAGSPINHRNKEGITALMIACMYQSFSSSINTINKLLENGANIDMQDNKGMTALMHSAKKSASFSSIEAVNLLLKYSNVNIYCEMGKTYWNYLPMKYKSKFKNPRDNIGVCVVCNQRMCNMYLSPCNHMITCNECKIKRCMCGEMISSSWCLGETSVI